MQDTLQNSLEQPFRRMSRRRFLGTTSMMAAASLLPVSQAFSHRRYLDIQGVKVGIITYSYRKLPSSAEELLEYINGANMDTIELMGGPAEAFAGAPESRRGRGKEIEEWRKTAPMDRFEELGAMYREGGIEIDILKLGRPDWPDEAIDYAFRAAKAVGARGISLEISNEAAERMGPFATKHELFVGLHNHTQVGDEGFSFDVPLSFSPYNMLNLDIGHYVAGTNESPIPVIKKYHDRITHLHLKDRKKGVNGGDNLPWGEGDTPIAEVLQLLQKEQYPITAMIELEYDIPKDSDVLTEVKKCVEYCRKALS